MSRTPVIAFTERRVADIPSPTAGRQTYRDQTSPLTLRVSAAGGKAWYVQRRVNGTPTRVRIGAWPDVKVADARNHANAEIGDMARGIDPRQRRQESQQAAQRRDYTVARALADYTDDAEQGLNRSRPLATTTIREYRRLADTTLKPMARLPLESLTGRELDAIRRKQTTSVANAAIRLLRAASNHAAERDIIAVSPFAGRKRQVVALPPRDRYIAEPDLGRFMVALDEIQAEQDPEEPRPPTLGEIIGADALLLITLYGLRKSEAMTLPWSAVNLTAGTFKLLDTKNKATLELPITAAARTVFDRRKELARPMQSKWVFPQGERRASKSGHLTELRHAVDRVKTATGLQFSPHDLRRSFVSLASRHLPYAMLKAVVNHAAANKGDVTLTHYVRVSAQDMRQPLESLHTMMDTLKAEAIEKPPHSKRAAAKKATRKGQRSSKR